jgi:hypothetical protein
MMASLDPDPHPGKLRDTDTYVEFSQILPDIFVFK